MKEKNSILHADDIVLIADAPGKLQQAVVERQEELKRKGMEINIEEEEEEEESMVIDEDRLY